MINIGVVGYGYWGPNIVRNFNSTANGRVLAVCDRDAKALSRLSTANGLSTTADYREIVNNPKIDAVAIVTPVSTHYQIAKEALENGKHVFVEKPFTASIREAEELIELAERKNLKLMVDHTFLFTGAVNKIKSLVDDGTLGDMLYFDSTRVNLGLFQHDVNVIWDLAPHDFSVLDFITKNKPRAVSANGFDHFKRGMVNTAYISIYYDAMIAHFNVNWMSPVKVRKTLIGGTKKMLVWDDLEPDEKIRIYDKGVDIQSPEGVHAALVNYRSGDASIPKIDHTEALKVEAQYFLNCISDRIKPINDGEAGLRIVKLIVAANASLEASGKEILI